MRGSDEQVSASNGHRTQEVTYAEVRRWARWLGVFTASDLADSVRCSHDVAEKFIKALTWHGICEETEDIIDGYYGPEYIVEYIPIPHQVHNRRKDTPPETIAVIEMGGFQLFNVRGEPVRIRSDKGTRKLMSTGGTRMKLLARERAYERQQEAIRKRREKDRKRYIARTQHRDLEDAA